MLRLSLETALRGYSPDREDWEYQGDPSLIDGLDM